MRFVEIDVSPANGDAIRLSWEVQTTPTDPIPKYRIFRSESPEGGFEEITDKPIKQRQYLDDPVNLLKKWREYYYKIQAVDDGDILVESNKDRIRTEPDAIALEIINRNNLLLKQYVSPNADQTQAGEKAHIYKKRTQGDRCPECWDPVKYRSKKDPDCEYCYGTGFVEGYIGPIEAYVNISPGGKQTTAQRTGDVEASQTSGWMSNYPVVKPEDIIVEPYIDKRWRIVRINPTQKGRMLVHQELSLVELDPDELPQGVEPEKTNG